MNYIAPTFNFQQGDELCFNTTPPFPTQQHLLPEMMVAAPSTVMIDSMAAVEDPHILQAAQPGNAINGDENNQSNNKKKINHREVERQRRHEMAMLYASLRSHLPTDCLKGKRSISDHMYEAANYIKHLQEKIRRLTQKRDMLRRAITSSPSNPTSSRVKGNSPLPQVTVQSCNAGVEVVISSGTEDEFPLSRLTATLIGEGFDVVSLVSTNICEKSVYALRCEAGSLGEVDLCGLKEKLIDAMQPWD